jgi:hypothetical protein
MTEQSDERKRMEAALTAVRREGQKAAAIYAGLDGVVVTLAVALALTVLGVDLGVTLPAPIDAVDALAVGVGLVVALAEFVVRIRRPLVEQFEAANPSVSEALRTARDATRQGADHTLARRLYADVLAALRDTSGTQLLDVRRVGATLVLVLALSVMTVQTGVAGIDLLDAQPTGPTDAADQPRRSEYTGLEDGDAILGEETDVSSGDEEIAATIGGTGDSRPGNDSTSSAGRDPVVASDGAYDPQQAGYATPDDVTNAAIIRDYNLRIRETTDD